MLVGYMGVSSADDRQSVDLQRDALVAGGVDDRHLYKDEASGARDDRSGLKACLKYLKAGDTLVVWKLDGLGRSLPHLLTIVTDLKTRGRSARWPSRWTRPRRTGSCCSPSSARSHNMSGSWPAYHQP